MLTLKASGKIKNMLGLRLISPEDPPKIAQGKVTYMTTYERSRAVFIETNLKRLKKYPKRKIKITVYALIKESDIFFTMFN